MVTTSDFSFSINRCGSVSKALKLRRFRKGKEMSPSMSSVCSSKNRRGVLLYHFFMTVGEASVHLLCPHTHATALFGPGGVLLYLSHSDVAWTVSFSQCKTSGLVQQSTANPQRCLPNADKDGCPQEGIPGTALGFHCSQEPFANIPPKLSYAGKLCPKRWTRQLHEMPGQLPWRGCDGPMLRGHGMCSWLCRQEVD